MPTSPKLSRPPRSATMVLAAWAWVNEMSVFPSKYCDCPEHGSAVVLRYKTKDKTYRLRRQDHGQRNGLIRRRRFLRHRLLHHLYAGEPITLHLEAAPGSLVRIARVKRTSVIGNVEDACEESWVLNSKGHVGGLHAPHHARNLLAREADFVAKLEDPFQVYDRFETGSASTWQYF